jgi:hypothetical protein
VALVKGKDLATMKPSVHITVSKKQKKAGLGGHNM